MGLSANIFHSSRIEYLREHSSVGQSVGANVNQKLFRGYATTAAVRESHIEILEILVNGGATQPACEEALLEASYVGQGRPAELLMGSSMIRPHVAVHALVTASCRGFVDVVDTIIKCGVDPNANARMLLRSSKPSLHTNVDCNALVAAIVSRQISIVRLLLQAGVSMNIKVRLGAWSWDMATGEEFKVGAGLAEPYCVTWCAVEYFEASGSILRTLLQHLSPNLPHLGRTVIHHAILCNNARAMDVLLTCGADIEFPVQTTENYVEVYPSRIPNLLSESPLIVSGRYKGDFPETLKARGILADMSNFVVDLKVQKAKDIPIDKVLAKQEIDLLTAQAWFSENKELEEKIARMSVKYGIVSEYTCMILLETERGKNDTESTGALEGCGSSKRKLVDVNPVSETPKLFTSAFKVPKLKNSSCHVI